MLALVKVAHKNLHSHVTSWLRTSAQPTSIFYKLGSGLFRVSENVIPGPEWVFFRPSHIRVVTSHRWSACSHLVAEPEVSLCFHSRCSVAGFSFSVLAGASESWLPSPDIGHIGAPHVVTCHRLQWEQICKSLLVARLRPSPTGDWDLPDWVINRKVPSTLTAQEAGE